MYGRAWEGPGRRRDGLAQAAVAGPVVLALEFEIVCRVADPDPLVSVSFQRIRIRFMKRIQEWQFNIKNKNQPKLQEYYIQKKYINFLLNTHV